MSEETGQGFKLWMLIPAVGAAMVLAVFMLGLQRDDIQRLPSALIGDAAPQFEMAPLRVGEPGLSTADLSAPGIKLVNVWASWCGPCRAEHPQIEALAAEGITIHGLNYKDAPENALAFLAELGDPYTLIGRDPEGRTGIDFGVYGVPETFVVNSEGVIVHKHVGPVMRRDMEKLRSAIEAASRQ